MDIKMGCGHMDIVPDDMPDEAKDYLEHLGLCKKCFKKMKNKS